MTNHTSQEKLAAQLREVIAAMAKATPGRWYYVHGYGWCCRDDAKGIRPGMEPTIRDAATYDGPPSHDEIAIRAAHNFLYDHADELTTILSEHGEVVITTDASGRCVAVTRQDGEGRILSTIWEASEHGGGGEATPPDANWCRTCGRHRNDPVAILCRDGCHDKLRKTDATPPTPTNGGEAVAWFPTNSNGEILRNYGDGSPVFASRTREEAEQAKRCHLGATGPVVPLYLRPFASSAPTLARTAAEKEWSEWSDRLRKLIGDRTEVLHFAADVQATDDGVRFDNCRFVHAPTPSAPVVDDAMVERALLARHDGWSVSSYFDDNVDGEAVMRSALTDAVFGVGVSRGRHWCFAAAEGLRPLVREMSADAGALGRTHLLSMLDRMKQEEMSATKGCRWLGWIQAALVDAGPATLEAMKAHNLRYSRESTLATTLSGVSAPVGVEELVAAARAVQRAARGEREPWDRLSAAIEQVEAALTPPAAAPRVAGQVPILPGNWPEDASHENGNYECRCVDCGETFYGHKRRVVCKVCTTPAAPTQENPHG